MLNRLRLKIAKRQRAIYRYFDGQAFVKADPMVLFRKLVSHPKLDLETHTQLIDDSDEDREIVLNAVRDIFGVKVFDGQTGEGLTEEETINLLWEFCSYCHAKKKSASPSPTSPPNTESTPQESPPEAWTTEQLSDSGSTSADAKFDMPPR